MVVEQLGVAGAGAQRRQAQRRGVRTAGASSRSAATGRGSGRTAYAASARSSRCSTSARSRSAVRARFCGDARTQLGLEQGQHVAADPRPGEPRVLVGRVGPPADVLGPAGLLGLGAGEVEQRPAEHPERPAHAGQRAAAAAPGRAPAARSRPGRRGCARAARSTSRSGRRAPRGRRTSPGGRPPRGRGPSPSTLTRIEAVSSAPSAAICPITWVATSADASCRPWSTVTPTTRPGLLARLEDGGGQQGQRVGAARAGDQDGGGAGVAGGERAPYGDPGGGDGGVGPGHGALTGPASPRRRDRRSRPWWAGGRGPARRR